MTEALAAAKEIPKATYLKGFTDPVSKRCS